VQVNSAISASASFTDSDTSNTHTAKWEWGDGNSDLCPPNSPACTITESNGSGTVTGSHTYASAGVYTITLTVTDNHSASGTSTYQYLAVYAPTSSGLFTGVRLFDNPTSATPNTAGQVKFGISVKYNTSNQPTGNVSMNFKNAGLDFTATSFDYLVTSGAKAYVKGSGTLNGVSGYTFLASGIDGHDTGGSDLIRFQIKDILSNVVYDSQPNAGDNADPTTSLTGQVIVH
jgi:PKD repeat protein